MVAPVEVYEAIDEIFNDMVGVTEILSDPNVTSVRLVMNPEKMVIKESQRALTYLSMYGMTVDTVVVNKILPVDQDSGYLNHWKDIQQRYLKDVEHSFTPLPIHHVPYYAEEVVGLEKLRQMGADVYHDEDPTQGALQSGTARYRQARRQFVSRADQAALRRCQPARPVPERG
jgi:arsenite-transporting ATPase